MTLPKRATGKLPTAGGDGLDERTRAEDILLGSLGFGEGATILSLERCGRGYAGRGRYSDGEEFEFSSDDELDQLQEWALLVIIGS